MDTPTSESTVEFSKAGDGYDPAQVDAVVTSMRAELASLRSQVRKSGPSSGRGGNPENTDRLHDPDRAVERMLAAAQQTADRVVYEAEAEAERVLAEADDEAVDRINKAEAKAHAHVEDAEAQGERIRKEAVTEARRVIEETRGPLAREVRKLRDTRDALRKEIDALRALLSTHRESVRNASDDLRSLADDPEVFRVADPGPRTEVDVNLDDDFEIEIAAADIDLREDEASEAETAADAAEPVTSESKAAPNAEKPAKADKSEPKAKAVKAVAEAKVVAPEPEPEIDITGPKAAAVTRSATSSAFSDSLSDGEVEVAAAPASARIVTLDDIKENADRSADGNAADGSAADKAAADDSTADETVAEEDNEVAGRVITGAFADQLDDDVDEDDLFRMGENAETPASDKAGFLDTVRKAADAESDGGLGEVDEAEGRAISNFFESAIEEPKSRFRRKN